jgi:hypothetical protein
MMHLAAGLRQNKYEKDLNGFWCCPTHHCHSSLFRLLVEDCSVTDVGLALFFGEFVLEGSVLSELSVAGNRKITDVSADVRPLVFVCYLCLRLILLCSLPDLAISAGLRDPAITSFLLAEFGSHRLGSGGLQDGPQVRSELAEP